MRRIRLRNLFNGYPNLCDLYRNCDMMSLCLWQMGMEKHKCARGKVRTR
jgi:hypothetical protein